MPKQQAYALFFADLCEKILTLPARGQSLFLYPHINADGDALGSCLAFSLLMEGFGVDCLILTEEALSPKLAFLPEAKRLIVSTYEGQPLLEEYGQRQGMALVIDSPGGTRIGRRLALFRQAAYQYTIDHHIPTEANGETVLVDTAAAASCEIVTALVLFLEAKYQKELLTENMATNLFCGLMTDTGRFTYSNTTANTLHMAAQLLRFKLDIRALSLQLFDSMSKAKLALMGYVNSHTEYFYEGQMAISLLPYAVFTEYEGDESDVEGLVTLLRDVIGVQLAILLRETPSGSYRASVRSSEHFDAQALAAQFEGGGHLRASGYNLPQMSAQAALRLSVEAAKMQFSK